MQAIHGIPLIQFEQIVCNKYINKIKDARRRELEFSLTFAEFRALLTKKRCAYTGVPLTFHIDGAKQTNTDLSIERIDNSRGYVRGNVMAVCYAANNIKSVFEDPNTFLSVKDAVRMFGKIDQLQKIKKAA